MTAPRKPARKTSWVWIVLGILGACGAVLFCGLMVAAYVVGRSPVVQRFGQIVGEGVELAQRAQGAPGAAELRAAGCRIAMVVRPEDLEELTRLLVDGGLPETERSTTVVTCVLGRGDPALTCEEVVRVYAAAVPTAPAEIQVSVSIETSDRPLCDGRYASDGTPLGP